MKKKPFILLPAYLLLISCHNNYQNKSESFKGNSTTIDLSKDSLSAHYNGLGMYSFKFNTNINGDSLTSIKVYSSNKILQEIKVNNFIETKKYQLADVNFDGFKDIMVLCESGSGGKIYWVWNFSPKTGNFQINKQLSDCFGLEIDSVNQLIRCSYRGGWNVKIWDTFKYVDEKLVLVSGRNIDRNDTFIYKR